jgi:hypothetical protein
VGHLRLGTLPDTAPWRRVVGLIAEGADAAAVASATTQAAIAGLKRAENDEGLCSTVWLLTQTVLAARNSDFAAALREAGIEVPDAPDVFAIVGAFSDAVDRRLRATSGRTDVGEMGQLAAVESLTALLSERSAGLFGTSAEEVHSAAYELSTTLGFEKLGHDFFARFARRFLTYHLGRELSSHVGGNGRFASPADHDAFLAQLDTHCRQAALIIKQFAGGWYSKQQYQGGITPLKARNFANYALTKLRRELQVRGARHGE